MPREEQIAPPTNATRMEVMTTLLQSEVITISFSPNDCEEIVDDACSVLLRSVKCHTASPWRLACPVLAVEMVEPYRTMILSREALRALDNERCDWQERILQPQKFQNLITPPFQFEIELYMPLTAEPQNLNF